MPMHTYYHLAMSYGHDFQYEPPSALEDEHFLSFGLHFHNVLNHSLQEVIVADNRVLQIVARDHFFARTSTIVLAMLIDVGVDPPVAASVISSVYSFAASFVINPSFSAANILPLSLNITATTTLHHDNNGGDEIDRAISESLQVFNTIPATVSSIAALEDVASDTSAPDAMCTICREALNGEQVLRMPCSHIYHRDCITQWLRISHVCPLCRHEMPTS